MDRAATAKTSIQRLWLDAYRSIINTLHEPRLVRDPGLARSLTATEQEPASASSEEPQKARSGSAQRQLWRGPRFR
jgi:hypothetical protein